MQIVIHRGTCRIGGVATEIRTAGARILIDMGDELDTERDADPAPLSIPGVTDDNGSCSAVLFTHNHGDHVGQMKNIRPGIPLYMGALSRELLLATLPKREAAMRRRVSEAAAFEPGKPLHIGDMSILPLSVDHSACDSYMFLIEAEGKRVLHTGDFRMHGFRGKAMPGLLGRLVGKVDVLITEGTTLSRPDSPPVTERELQQRARACMERYKYVFVLCASTNLERICALSKAVPRGRYFLCDEYQSGLLERIEHRWGKYSPLYRNIKKTVYGTNRLPQFRARGFLMIVRDNPSFRRILRQFDPEQSILLYSMWDGYRTQPGSTIPDFLNLAGRWETLHTSGHASPRDIRRLVETVDPDRILPIHTTAPAALQTLCPGRNILQPRDGEEITL